MTLILNYPQIDSKSDFNIPSVSSLVKISELNECEMGKGTLKLTFGHENGPYKIWKRCLSEGRLCVGKWIWPTDGLVVNVLDFQSRGPLFKTTWWLQGRLSLSSF